MMVVMVVMMMVAVVEVVVVVVMVMMMFLLRASHPTLPTPRPTAALIKSTNTNGFLYSH